MNVKNTHNRLLHKKKLALAISLLTLGCSASTYAEEAAQPEEVIITGIRGALKAAIDIKRDSDAVVDAISAEDIGKFPDKNIAESLQRVPGVSINRGFTGEGNEVSIRGTNPELTSVLLNGQYVSSTGWFRQTNARRSFNMDLMPSEMVKKVEVYKSPTASLDEGGVGGTVIVETRKPLELNANTVFASIEGQTNTLASGETGGGATGMYSWKNEAETFGILGAISTLKTLGRADKAENYWEDGWAGSGIAEFNQDRTRDAYDITAQLAPSDELTLTGHFFETHIDAANTNQNFLVVQLNNVAATPPHYTSHSGHVTPNGAYTIGNIDANFGAFDDANSRKADVKSDTFSVSADYKVDSFTVSGVLGTTKADGGDGGNMETTWGIQNINQTNNPGVSADINMDSSLTTMQYKLNGLSAADGTWQRAVPGFFDFQTSSVHDKENYAQVDAKFDVEFGVVNKIETGLKFRNHDFDTNRTANTYNGTAFYNAAEFAAETAAGGPLNWGLINAANLSSYQDGVISHSGEGLVGGSQTKIARLDVAKARAEFTSHMTAAKENKALYFALQEDVSAFYTQADVEGQGFSGNVGLRVVKTDVTGTRYTAKALQGLDDSKENIDGSYADILPSMNWKLDLSDTLIARFSASKVLSRPGYTSMNPALAYDFTTKKASSGDPTLDPYRATQIDMGVEWYFTDSAIASASVFTKDIGSFLNNVKTIEPITDSHGTFNYEVTKPSQGSGGKIQGIEIQYQQNFGNFGAIANYTYVDSSGKDASGKKVALAGTSRNSYNLTGYYEQDIFSVRLAYTNRSEFLAEGLGIGGSETYAGQEFLDGTATWHVTENVDLSFDVQNALGEVTTTSIPNAGVGASGNTLRVSNDNGTRYFLKASFKM